MTHLALATAVLVILCTVMGAAVGLPWTGAGVGLAVSVGLVIFLGD